MCSTDLCDNRTLVVQIKINQMNKSNQKLLQQKIHTDTSLHRCYTKYCSPLYKAFQEIITESLRFVLCFLKAERSCCETETGLLIYRILMKCYCSTRMLCNCSMKKKWTKINIGLDLFDKYSKVKIMIRISGHKKSAQEVLIVIWLLGLSLKKY